MNSRRIAGCLLAASLLTLCARAADAQWVFLARKVIGRVESMQQTPKPGTPTYDVASVVLDAPSTKVYQTVVSTVKSHPENRITQRDDRSLNLEVSRGPFTVGIHVVALQDKVSQLIIAAVVPPGQQSPTSYAVQHILQVCAQMKVTCYRAESGN
jgi:hypothetical protein